MTQLCHALQREDAGNDDRPRDKDKRNKSSQPLFLFPSQVSLHLHSFHFKRTWTKCVRKNGSDSQKHQGSTHTNPSQQFMPEGLAEQTDTEEHSEPEAITRLDRECILIPHSPHTQVTYLMGANPQPARRIMTEINGRVPLSWSFRVCHVPETTVRETTLS